MKAHPVRMTIANTHDYALRRLDDPVKYTQVLGEIHGSTQRTYRRDLKFRSFGTPIECSSGVKELHLGIRGSLEYSIGLAQIELIATQANYSREDIARIGRYHHIIADIDIELWAFSDAIPMPIRSSERLSEIDSDWTPNAPMSRIRVTQQVDLYENPKTSFGFGEIIANALGDREHSITSFVATPIVRVDTLAPIVVPVVTMHIGGRTMAADGIQASFELQGKAFYL